jgi:hypothetical protein
VLFFMMRTAYRFYHEEKGLHELVFKEFEEYKHTTLEKQIKLSRELQDYRNRMAETKKV